MLSCSDQLFLLYFFLSISRNPKSSSPCLLVVVAFLPIRFQLPNPLIELRPCNNDKVIFSFMGLVWFSPIAARFFSYRINNRTNLIGLGHFGYFLYSHLQACKNTTIFPKDFHLQCIYKYTFFKKKKFSSLTPISSG